MKFTFTEHELTESAAQFRLLDTDSKELLCESDLETLLSDMSINAAFSKLLFRLFDLDKDDALNFSEFALFLKGADLLKRDPLEFHKFVFNAVDIDDDNKLEASEFALFCDLLGVSLSVDAAATVLCRISPDTQSLTFEQLCVHAIEPLTHIPLTNA